MMRVYLTHHHESSQTARGLTRLPRTRAGTSAPRSQGHTGASAASALRTASRSARVASPSDRNCLWPSVQTLSRRDFGRNNRIGYQNPEVVAGTGDEQGTSRASSVRCAVPIEDAKEFLLRRAGASPWRADPLLFTEDLWLDDGDASK